jgi:hypothetical protein
MSNLINPWLVEGYVDEQDTGSAQGCYIGADTLFEGEMAAEKAIQAERERLIYIRNLKQSIKDLKRELAQCSVYHHRKRERIENKICELENELKQIE